MTRHRGVLSAALALALAPRASAQVLRLQPNGNEIGLESRAERWWYNGLTPSQFATFGEWISVSASGMLISPGFFAWSGTIRPYIGQQDGTETVSAFDSRNLGLTLGGNLLSAYPLSLAFNAHRSSGSMRAGAGGENEFFTSGGGAVVSWRNHWFPMTLDVSRRSTEDSWTSVRSLAPIRRDEVLRDVRLLAQSTKTSLLIDQIRFRDRLGPLSFASLDGTLQHALRWGSGSVLTTTLQRGDREGSYPYHRGAVGAQVRLQQSQRAVTDLFAQRRSGSSAGVQADSRAAGATFRLQNREWWSNSLSASWNSTNYTADGGSSNAAYIWRSQFNRRLRGERMLNGSLAASFERLDQWSSGSAFIFVVDERYTVEGNRSFTLLNARVDTSTLVLRNADQTIAFVPDIDYRLVPVGATVRVQVLPGSRLAIGDIVVASYRFEALHSGRHNIGGLAVDASYGSSGFMLRASESIREANGSGNSRDAKLLSGRDFSAGLTMRRAWRGGRVEFDAQHRNRAASANDFVTNEMRLGFVPRGSAQWQSNVGIRGSASSVAGERLTMVSADAAGTWSVSPTIRLLATGEHWLWMPSNTVTESYFAGSFEVNWQFGRIESSIRYMAQRRVAKLDNNQHRVTARIVRRF